MEQGKQMRFTEDELRLIRDTFKGNDRLLKLMRKVFKIYTINVKLGIIKLWETIDMIFIFVERGGRLKS